MTNMRSSSGQQNPVVETSAWPDLVGRSRALIIAHSASLRDCHLWRRLMLLDASVHLVLPGRDKPDWVLKSEFVDRVSLLPRRSLGTETSTWLSGLRKVLEIQQPAVIHVDAEPWAFTVQWLTRREWPVIAHGAENVILQAPWVYRARRTGLKSSLQRLAGYAAWGDKSLDAMRAAGLPGDVPSIVVPARPPSSECFNHVPPGERTSTLHLAAVGRFEHEKGFDTVIAGAVEASAQGPIELHLMGQGPERERLKRLAATSGISVQFHAPGDTGDVARLLAWSDAAVIASRDTRRWSEQWCRVAAEAMLIGRPVLASSSGELPTTVGITDWLFEPGNIHQLAARLNSIRGTRERVRAFALASQQAKRFDIDRYSERTLAFWDRVRRAREGR